MASDFFVELRHGMGWDGGEAVLAIFDVFESRGLL